MQYMSFILLNLYLFMIINLTHFHILIYTFSALLASDAFQSFQSVIAHFRHQHYRTECNLDVTLLFMFIHAKSHFYSNTLSHCPFLSLMMKLCSSPLGIQCFNEHNNLEHDVDVKEGKYNI
jgi:hypothetical protein